MIAANLVHTRYERLVKAMRAAGLPALALNPGQSLIYLTGLPFHLMERPVLAFFIQDAPVVWVIPALERQKMDGFPLPSKIYTYGDDPAVWDEAFRQAIGEISRLTGTKTLTFGIEPSRMRVLEEGYVQTPLEGVPARKLVPAEDVLASLRACKDAAEAAAMKKAVEIAQEGLLAALKTVREGITERELASTLTLEMLKRGADPELPFAPIVSFGENTANPHASPSERALKRGDLLLVDWGAYYQGYASDLTRTFSFGEPDPEFRRIAGIVLQANETGRRTAGPEVIAADVDAAARKVIEEAGYGAQFTHRLGHGLGMDCHEHPYINGANKTPLLPGNTFTIEPGIYLSGRGGIRIEDNCLVTPGGCETLSSLPRELINLEI